ncbi:MAG TPA: AmmeMemoRadiSam system radical SAM enzyme [Myxococcota bacterium]|nr:AmmeMemoRadiSam system radical SAM enzyme [Myxococcota bacterium]HQK49562.1 AmmeMemoRadiSam system radical SAM enzyme [Myxococcota bacterium]
MEDLAPARFWEPADGLSVRCHLCPARCLLPDGGAGRCGARTNRGGVLFSRVYGHLKAVNLDPIEKKPLYHVLPDTPVLSVGTSGCNLTCAFCQNWSLSRAPSMPAQEPVSPTRLVGLAERHRCPSIAFTYNEPTIQAEYVMDAAALARRQGLKVVMVTNGYITPEALPEVYRDVDAANVDLKSFDDDFYRQHCGGSLPAVLKTLEALVRQGVFLEVTTLVIPGLNDTPEEMRREAAWIRDHLGAGTPLHLSAFHPDHRMRDRPPTPRNTLAVLREAARAEGLSFVYEGNIPGGYATTVCPGCGKAVVDRTWFTVTRMDLTAGRCRHCGHRLPGIWE